MPKYFVISGTHDQFSEWRRRNGTELLLNHQIENLSDIVYVAGADTLKGTSNPTGVFIGTWYTRADMLEVLTQLRVATTDIEKMKVLSQVLDHYVKGG